VWNVQTTSCGVDFTPPARGAETSREIPVSYLNANLEGKRSRSCFLKVDQRHKRYGGKRGRIGVGTAGER